MILPKTYLFRPFTSSTTNTLRYNMIKLEQIISKFRLPNKNLKLKAIQTTNTR